MELCINVVQTQPVVATVLIVEHLNKEKKLEIGEELMPN